MYLSFSLLVLYDLPFIPSILTPSPAQPSLKKKKKSLGNKAPFGKLAWGHNVVWKKCLSFQHLVCSCGSGRISASQAVRAGGHLGTRR